MFVQPITLRGPRNKSYISVRIDIFTCTSMDVCMYMCMDMCMDLWLDMMRAPKGKAAISVCPNTCIQGGLGAGSN